MPPPPHPFYPALCGILAITTTASASTTATGVGRASRAHPSGIPRASLGLAPRARLRYYSVTIGPSLQQRCGPSGSAVGCCCTASESPPLGPSRARLGLAPPSGTTRRPSHHSGTPRGRLGVPKAARAAAPTLGPLRPLPPTWGLLTPHSEVTRASSSSPLLSPPHHRVRCGAW